MELIRKIKQAEEQARETVEQAKADAVRAGEDARVQRGELQVVAEHDRVKAVEAAVSQARSQAQSDVVALKEQAAGQRRELREETSGKTAAAVEKVLKYLRG